VRERSIAVVGVWLVAGLAGPSEAAERRLSLTEALSLAEQANPELLAARERASAQTARGGSVRRQGLPRVSANLAWSRSDNPAFVFASKLNAGEFTQADFAVERLNTPGGLSHLTSVLALEAPLDLAGRLRDQGEAQAAVGRALEHAAREALLELRLRVSDAYHRAHLAERAVEVTARALAAAQARESQLLARVDEGVALVADQLRARARRRQREAELAERNGDLEIALAGLARALGAGAGERLLPEEPAGPPAPPAADVSAWLERAERQRPALQAALERSGGARLQRRVEQRSSWPELGAFAQLQDDRNGFASGGQSATIGLGLRVNLFDAGRGKRLAAAAADERAAEHERRAAADQVRLELTAALRRAQAARQRRDAAQGGAEEGREALRVVRERRLAGLATLTDELDTEAAALGAELQELQAAMDLAVADAALRRAAGEL
jgi:outer membrane protein TolC